MPEQQMGPISRYVPPESFGNAIYKGMANIRAGQASRSEQDLRDAQIKKLETENSPENQNYLRQEKQAELSKKQNDAKTSGLDIYTKRLPLIQNTEEFTKALPTLMKDLEPFGEEGAKELLPRVTFKTDLSGQKQIPDEEAFLKETARITDALSKVSGKVKVKPYDTAKWTKDIKDEATGKMKTVDVTMVYQPDGTWAENIATAGGIKDDKPDRPYRVGQIIKKQGAGGIDLQGTVTGFNEDGTAKVDKWANVTKPDKPDKPDKPEMTEPQARKELFEMAKLEKQLADDYSLSAPEKAEQKKAIKEQREYLNSFIKGKATASKSAGATPAAVSKDKFGYKVGETRNVNGKNYKYIGNDKWQN